MESIASRLPAALGSGAGLVVALISFMAEVPPATCVLRATAACAVFAAFGMVMRCLLTSTPSSTPEAEGPTRQPPTVAEMLGEAAREPRADDGAPAVTS
ncbi:MAG TPA: hypothetical protein VLH79_06740 [Chthonomonadales bacterium]|nr:hypothetical protein [Chthonomonadales bacterium]